MISLILWVIAPIFNAIMDLVENENFTSSIFFRDPQEYNAYPKQVETTTKWNNWWYKRESDDHVKLIFGYRPDAWHISKSIMIILIIISAIIGIYIEGPFFHFFNNNKWFNPIFEVVIRGLWWNAIFSVFYHKLFRSKTWGK